MDINLNCLDGFVSSQRAITHAAELKQAPVGVGALELPRDAGADRSPLGCGIRYAESCLAEKDGLRLEAYRKMARKTGSPGKGFWARHEDWKECFALAAQPVTFRAVLSATLGIPLSGSIWLQVSTSQSTTYSQCRACIGSIRVARRAGT